MVNIYIYMVGGKTSPLKNDGVLVTVGMIIPISNWMESHKTVPNHQPAMNLWLWRNGDFQWLTINTWWIEKKKRWTWHSPPRGSSRLEANNCGEHQQNGHLQRWNLALECMECILFPTGTSFSQGIFGVTFFGLKGKLWGPESKSGRLG